MQPSSEHFSLFINSAGILGARDVPDVMDAIEALTQVAPIRASDPNAPCVAVAQHPDFVVECPPIEKRLIFHHLDLTVFWAWHERWNKPVLVGYDTYDVTNNPQDAWIVIPNETWEAMPMSHQLLRLFSSPDVPRHMRNNNLQAIYTSERIGPHTRIDVHRVNAQDIEDLAHSNLLNSLAAERTCAIDMFTLCARASLPPLTLNDVLTPKRKHELLHGLAVWLRGWEQATVLQIRPRNDGTATIVVALTDPCKWCVRLVGIALERDMVSHWLIPAHQP